MTHQVRPDEAGAAEDQQVQLPGGPRGGLEDSRGPRAPRIDPE